MQSQAQQFTTITTSLMSLTRAAQNFKNIGSIWNNDDLTLGEKLLQTFTNLGTTALMVVPAYKKLNEVYQAHLKAKGTLITVNKGEVAAEGAAAAASGVNAASKEVETGATEGATAATDAFNKTLLASPITWVVAGIMAVVAALSALVGAYDKANEASIENSKE